MKLGNKDYKLVFSISAIEAIEDKVGEVENIEILMDGKGRFKNIVWLLTLAINSWIKREKAIDPEFPLEMVTEDFVSTVVNWNEIPPIINELLSAFNGSSLPPAGLDDEEDGDDDPN